MIQADRCPSLVVVLHYVEVEHAHADDQAPQDTHQVRVNAEKGHHDGEGKHPGQYEEFHR